MGNRTGYQLVAGMTAGWLARGAALLKTLGPYAALGLLLPGGSLIALLLWLYQHRRRGSVPPAGKRPSFGYGLAAAQDELRAVSGTALPRIRSLSDELALSLRDE